MCIAREKMVEAIIAGKNCNDFGLTSAGRAAENSTPILNRCTFDHDRVVIEHRCDLGCLPWTVDVPREFWDIEMREQFCSLIEGIKRGTNTPRELATHMRRWVE